MSRSNQWYLPGDGIAREVITTEIQRYLGPDATVRPGFSPNGDPGYIITAYRTLTNPMIDDLKYKTQRWHNESRRLRSQAASPSELRSAYQNSSTFAEHQAMLYQPPGPPSSASYGAERLADYASPHGGGGGHIYTPSGSEYTTVSGHPSGPSIPRTLPHQYATAQGQPVPEADPYRQPAATAAVGGRAYGYPVPHGPPSSGAAPYYPGPRYGDNPHQSSSGRRHP